MNTMKWLLRREFWENKGSLFWAPAIVTLIIVVVAGSTIAYAALANGTANLTINGHAIGVASTLASMPEAGRLAMARQIGNGYMAMAIPLFGVMSFVIFFYCLATLYDDRRDRSILFWKSLPISDEMTVLSKVITALGVAPLITMVFATILSLCMLLLSCLMAAMKGVNLFGMVFSTSQVYLAPLQMLAMWPVYILWALPSIGWLMMVSAWARSKVFSWAVGVPLFVLALIKWTTILLGDGSDNLVNANLVARNVMLRLLLVEPGSWFLYTDNSWVHAMFSRRQGIDLSEVVASAWASLASGHAIGGVAAGAAMIYAAVRLRRWREDA